MSPQRPGGEEILRGEPLAPGLAVGPVCLLGRFLPRPVSRRTIAEAEIPAELARLERALAGAQAELRQAQERLRLAAGELEAEVFRAHRRLLEDPSFRRGVERLIRQDRLNAAAAAAAFLAGYEERLAGAPAEYLRERALDFADLARRLACQLEDCSATHQCRLHERGPVIVYAPQLLPGLLAEIAPENIAGIAAGEGAASSHAAILARALDVPVVAGLPGLGGRLRCGQQAALDGDHGLLILGPDEPTAARYRQGAAAWRAALHEWAALEPRLADGTPLVLEANAAGLSDVVLAERHRAAGVGLFRTEYPFLLDERQPGEEDLFRLYREVVARAPGPVTFRLLDVGGDKLPRYLSLPREENPFLGQRGVRLYRRHRALIEPQVAALLRAAAAGPLRLLIPMVSTVEEVEEVRACLAAQARALAARGVPHRAEVELGVMIETPAAFLGAARLLARTDFASLGTNDLTQYVMAFDRNHPEASPLGHGLQPALLGVYAQLARLGRERGREIGCCGELASRPENLPVLIGLGLRRFSLNPPALPPAKRLLNRLTLAACEELARRLLALDRLEEVQAALAEFHERLGPD